MAIVNRTRLTNHLAKLNFVNLGITLKRENYLLVFTLLASIALMISVHVMEFGFGIRPCQLCIYQRYPYFAVIGLGALWLLLILFKKNFGLFFGTGALVLMFVTGTIALYQMGVEWGVFQSSCSGNVLTQELIDNFDSMESLLSKGSMPPCDQPYLLFGISLSIWNFMVSMFLACCITLSVKNFVKRKDLC